MKFVSSSVVILLALMICGCKPEQGATEVVVEETETAAVAPVEQVTEVVELDPALIDSAMSGDLTAVKKAISEGLDVNALAEGNRTLLMFAAFEGRVDVVKALIDAGFDVNHKDVTARTSLMYAASGTSPETVKVLLESGADVNAIDSHENWTALMMAAAEGNTEICRMLIEAGADPKAADVDGENSAYFARQRGFEALAQELEKATKVSK